MSKQQRQRIIAFHPELARKLGDIASAIFYQQMWYWGDKGERKDGFIYKTKIEIEEETTITRDQQDRIRKNLVNKKWLEVKKEKINGAPTLLYKALIDINIVIGKVENPLMEKSETDVSSIHRLHHKKEFSKENSLSSSKLDTPPKKKQVGASDEIKEVRTGEDGEEIGVKEKKVMRPILKEIHTTFRDLCEKHIGTKPLIQIGKSGAIIKFALQQLSEEEIYDLFDWWFEDPQEGKKDYDLIQITQALSSYNISKYKIQHGK